MKKIPLNKGKVALVDDEDYAILSLFKWYAHKKRNTYYAVTNIVLNNKQITLQLHRFLLNAKKGQQSDHINRYSLDNRKCNLRFCTHSENQMNRYSNKNSTSKYKGVSWHKASNKWCAKIRFNGESIHLGVFKNERDAAKVYDKKAKELFKEFANINFKNKEVRNDQRNSSERGTGYIRTRNL